MRERTLRGFTLVEILVALAVLAIALSAVMRLTAQTIDTTVALRDRSLALWVAQDRLTEHLVLQDWPNIDTTDGKSEMGGREWFWREQVSGTENVKMRRIEITVRLTANDEAALARLVGYVHDPAVKVKGLP